MQRLFCDVDRSGKWLMGGNHDGLVSAWNVSMDQDDGAHLGECNEPQQFDGSVQSLSHTWRPDVSWRAGTGEFCAAKIYRSGSQAEAHASVGGAQILSQPFVHIPRSHTS